MRRLAVAASLLLSPAWAIADTWPAPEIETIVSSNGKFRVTVEPSWGDRPSPPIAHLERLQATDQWQTIWRQPLVNTTAPVDTLVTDDGKYVVTLDNWGWMGRGDDVVVVYDERGDRLHQFGMDRLLPPLLIRHLPRSVSSLLWRAGQSLTGPGQILQIEVRAPRPASSRSDMTAAIHLDLASGRPSWPGHRSWLRMLSTAAMLELDRLEAWKALRHLRSRPLTMPATPEASDWHAYADELLARVRRPGERIRAMVLVSSNEGPSRDNGHEIWTQIAEADTSRSYSARSFLFASPNPTRLTDVVARALAAKAPGSLSGARILFVGYPDANGRLAAAAAQSGAELSFIDPAKPYPPGTPLAEEPDPFWMPMAGRRPRH